MNTVLIRSLARRPSLSLTIVLMLALAIGANPAIYSVAKGVILTPLPFPDPDRVVRIASMGGLTPPPTIPKRRPFATNSSSYGTGWEPQRQRPWLRSGKPWISWQ